MVVLRANVFNMFYVVPGRYMPSDCSAIFQVEANVMGDIVLTISNRLEENVNDEVGERVSV